MLWILEQVEQLNPAEVLACLPLLSEARRARVLGMQNESARVRSILAELLLRHALREEYGLTELPAVETGEKGKPFFPDRPDLHFNLSHCKTAVACALDKSPVGVDVQEVRPLRREKRFGSAGPETAGEHLPHAEKALQPETAAEGTEHRRQAAAVPAVYRILASSERAFVEAGATVREQDRRFTAVWTCKEAYGKAVGDGFLYDMKAVEFRPTRACWKQYGFTFQHLDLDHTLLTLCASGSLPMKRLRFSDLLLKSECRPGGMKMKHFLIVVDMQKDFINGSLGTPEAVAIRPAVVEKIRSFDGEIIATLDTHGPDYLNTAEGRKLPVEHCVKGTPGWQLAPDVRSALKAHGYTALEKPTFGSLILPQLIRDRAGEEDFDIELIGLCTDICVISNALLLKACFYEKSISVDPACCAGVTPEKHKAALEVMKSCQINMIGE